MGARKNRHGIPILPKFAPRLTLEEEQARRRERNAERIKKYGDRCHYCGEILTVENFTIDHVVAKSKGGPNHDMNYRPACHDCNYKKKALTLDEFRYVLFPDRRMPRVFYFETVDDKDKYVHIRESVSDPTSL